MITHLKTTLVTVALSSAVCTNLSAFPGSGANCAQCHGSSQDRSDVSGNDSVTDPGNGNSLPTYDVTAGDTVSLAVTYTSSPGGSAFANLRGMDDATGVGDAGNTLAAWSIANLNGWTERTVSGETYYTIPVSQGNTYSIDLALDASTPADFYELQFVVAGQEGGLWNSETPFYLNVAPVPEPSTYALLGTGLLLGAAQLRRRMRR